MSVTEQDLADRRARNEEIARAGERWLEVKREEIAKLPSGTVVIFDVETGDYVTAATRIEAMNEYDRKIGQDRAGFIHVVGHRAFLGGGLLG